MLYLCECLFSICWVELFGSWYFIAIREEYTGEKNHQQTTKWKALIKNHSLSSEFPTIVILTPRTCVHKIRHAKYNTPQNTQKYFKVFRFIHSQPLKSFRVIQRQWELRSSLHLMLCSGFPIFSLSQSILHTKEDIWYQVTLATFCQFHNVQQSME